MSWATDNLRTASFRGIEFKVTAHDAVFEKAVVVHEFPGLNRPFIEEMGQVAKRFEIDAFLVGDDYLDRRDKLIDALLEAGPGQLVHPWLGTKNVHAVASRVRESAEESRMCRIAIAMVEARTTVPPEVRADPASRVESAGRVVFDAAAEDLADVVAGADDRGALAEGGATAWERIAETFATFDLSGPASIAASVRSKIQTIGDGIVALVSAPSDFASAIDALFRSIEEAVESRVVLIGLLLGLCGDETARVQPLLYGGIDADQGDLGVSRFIARASAIAAARVALQVDWQSYDDAYRVRQQIVAVLEDLAEQAEDSSFGPLQDLIAELVDGLPSPDANLPHLDQVTLKRSRPALVLSYQLYDTTARDEEIVARNHLPNPAFLPALEALEVLVDVG